MASKGHDMLCARVDTADKVRRHARAIGMPITRILDRAVEAYFQLPHTAKRAREPLNYGREVVDLKDALVELIRSDVDRETLDAAVTLLRRL